MKYGKNNWVNYAVSSPEMVTFNDAGHAFESNGC